MRQAAFSLCADDLWRRGGPAQTWYAFGRYYAMYPQSFADEAVLQLTKPGDGVLDPFCGRGNGPYVAAAQGRPAWGVDINEVAYLFSSVKMAPAPLESVLRRLDDLRVAMRAARPEVDTEFMQLCYCPAAQRFLAAARRDLDWRGDAVDRALMGFIAMHMQDKLGRGLSNALWPTIACSEEYAVSWWTKRGMSTPPDLDPVAVIAGKVQRRYAAGAPDLAQGRIDVGPAQQVLPQVRPQSMRLLLTSPPYAGVTDYWNEQWLRLWLLGHGWGKSWSNSQRHPVKQDYEGMLHSVFQAAHPHMRQDAFILVRSDMRTKTADAALRVLRRVWPGHAVEVRTSTAALPGNSYQHGKGASRAKEVDFLLRPPGAGASESQAMRFSPLESSSFGGV